MNKQKIFSWASALCISAAFTACSSDKPEVINPDDNTTTSSKFVLSVAVDKASYLLTADDLTQGKTSVVGNGLTSDAVTNWISMNGNYWLGLIYKQGNPATALAYRLNAAGNVEKLPKQYDVKRYTSFGVYNNNAITVAAADSDQKDAEGNVAKMLEFTVMDIDKGTTAKQTVMSENFLGNGEYVTLAGFQQVGDMIYTAVIPMGLSVYGAKAEGGKFVIYPDLVAKEDGGSKSGAWKKGELQWTQYPNKAWVAIYNGTDFSQKPTIISTDKISYAAGRFKSQYYQMIYPDANGDLYVFSPNFSSIYFTGDVQRSNLPAGVVRIKKGEKDFDPDYYVNLQEQAGGKSFIRVWYAGESYFLLQMFSGDMGKNAEGADQLAIFDAKSKQLRYVTGLPAAGEYSFVSNPTPYLEKGKMYFPVNLTNANPVVYVIDVATAKATKGMEVEGTTLSSITKLSINR